MNEQEIFTKVWIGLESQGWQKSVAVKYYPDSKDMCQYRGHNGMKCAAGHLIPDEKYKREMESKRIHAILEDHPDLFGEPLDKSIISFLDLLQRLHDDFGVPCEGSLNTRSMRDSFEAIAKVRNLAIPRKATP